MKKQDIADLYLQSAFYKYQILEIRIQAFYSMQLAVPQAHGT